MNVKTVDFDTDEIPTSHYILIVDKNGGLVNQMTIREARDYSPKHMLGIGIKRLNSMFESGTLEI